ncbi:serine hydrolase domain-containing protein [Winogradskyella bathintestinalis]|uniref:Serine hydrolase domain-containing protein n=1 Tax=Winogradskyella bathintestinalis TaxID=3035208 RepID=A0ABT7ZZ22_9FLAO|nr:serine hydrolase domain-containing protein [Winogradskyella bathintestinalis]MDN3494254.1 serine hydrolase domain-containing protein [Winogradskyella bathintestinalis]
MKITNLIILLFLGQIIFAQSRAEKIDSVSQIIHNKNPEVAISIGFIDNGKEYFFNYGNISRENNANINKNTIYEIGSITKLLTANLIAQAQEEGKLKIDEFIDDYIPEEYTLPKNIRNKIKISDLASHQSGLPDLDFEKLMKLKPKQPLDVNKETIHSIINDSTELLDYGNYRYSNISYTLLGMILEKVYEEDFEKILRDKILVPAQMSNTYTTKFDVKNRVTGYDINGVEQDYFNWNPLTAPAGLLKSNSSDMTKFLKTLLSNSGQISKATEITENTYYKNTQREVGFGQEIARIQDDTFFYKTGDTFSGSSIIAYDKKSNWGIIILINQHNSDLIRNLFNSNYEKALE